MKKWLDNPLFILSSVAFLVFFTHMDALLVNIMEARNFITAREMIQDGHWLLTTINGEARYQKPPLPTWLTAFSAIIFGIKNLAALRLPAAIMGFFTVLMTYALALELTKNKVYALISGLILTTSFYIVFAGRNGQWDIFTHGFMMGGIYTLHQLFQNTKHWYAYGALTGLFLGASFMSKGPVSLYALFLPFIIAILIQKRYSGFRQRAFPLMLASIIALLISSWWHLYINANDAATLAQITKKETANWTSYNVKPFYYYWSFFIQSGLWTIMALVSLFYGYLKNRVSAPKTYALVFWWTISAVILLSLIPEKKPRYLLPVLIPLALNTGFYLEYVLTKFQSLSRIEKLPIHLHFGLLGSICLIFPLAAYQYLNEALADYNLWFLSLSCTLVLIGLLIFWALIKKRIRIAFYASIAMILSIITLGLPMSPALSINPDFTPLSQVRQWQAQENIALYEYGSFTPELIWDYGQPIPQLTNEQGLSRPEHDRFGVIVSQDNIKPFKESFTGFSITKIRRYDMNPQGEDHRMHRPRLWRDLFLVEKISVPAPHQ
ncbi:glycosyltransferase family 39 protein [Flavobacteriaceae bacterium]|nr:glycosyltransferase family 39 protein [Flavobacteriaceae bacterium]